MNYIDLFAMLLLGLFILIGYNQGFLKSMFNVVNIVLAILIGLVFYGVVAKDISSNPEALPAVVHFSESSELIGGIENEQISIYEKSYEEIQTLIDSLRLPYPLADLLEKNIQKQAFAGKGIDKLGDYLGQTIGAMTINYVSFVVVFIIALIIIFIIISISDYVFEFPVLRSMDSVAGGICGLLQGLLFLNIVFLIIPLILTFLPFDELMRFVEGSSFTKLYYFRNILIKLIRGVI